MVFSWLLNGVDPNHAPTNWDDPSSTWAKNNPSGHNRLFGALYWMPMGECSAFSVFFFFFGCSIPTSHYDKWNNYLVNVNDYIIDFKFLPNM